MACWLVAWTAALAMHEDGDEGGRAEQGAEEGLACVRLFFGTTEM